MVIASTFTSSLLRGLILLLGGLLLGTGLGQAQGIGNLAGHDADAQQVLPVWNTRSGQLEALLLLSPESESDGTLDYLSRRESVLPGLGLGLTLGDGSRLEASLRPEANTGLALLCNQGIHVAMSLGVLGQQCLLAQVGAGEDALLPGGQSQGLKLDSRWQSAGGGFDLNFGLSWLEASLRSDASEFDPLRGVMSRSAVTAMPLVLGDLNQRRLYLDGRMALGNNRWLSLGGSVGSHELDTLLGAPLRWDNAMVTFGVSYGGLSGRLTGRLIELPAGQGSYSGLDLGFSWRTPWQGELSFGAQNLLNSPSPDSSTWPMSELPALEAPGGRTPYVRYKQDL